VCRTFTEFILRLSDGTSVGPWERRRRKEDEDRPKHVGRRGGQSKQHFEKESKDMKEYR
jgi:hypothetical protein